MGYCEHNCLLMTILIPHTVRKSSLEREHPFLRKFFVHSGTVVSTSTMHRLENMSMRLNRKTRVTRSDWCSVNFRSFSLSLRHKFFGFGTRQNLACLFQSLSLLILFSTIIRCTFWARLFLRISLFAGCWAGNCYIPTRVSVSFSVEEFGAVSAT